MDSSFIFGVRHHSPAASLVLSELLRARNPKMVLIEGPSDFNNRIQEMALGHSLPFSIYSYLCREDGERYGVFYPFCENSPEWIALDWAFKNKRQVFFIDLPLAVLSSIKRELNRSEFSLQAYTDAQIRKSQYIEILCRRLGVDSFDDLWDELFEVQPSWDVSEFITRFDLFCFQSRELENLDPEDDAREAFMATEIARHLSGCKMEDALVICGGFHKSALLARLEKGNFISQDLKESYFQAECIKTRGLALSPYSDARMDALTGYESGLPGPAFYREVFRARREKVAFNADMLLGELVLALRKKGHAFSTADLIAAKTSSRCLADLRAHADVWRRDLLDGLRTALVKEEVSLGEKHPVLQVLQEVYRGNRIGKLAKGTQRPPLVEDICSRLESYSIFPEKTEKKLQLNLRDSAERELSRLLHCLCLLSIPGFKLNDFTDMKHRHDLSTVTETWVIVWIPEFEAMLIEASHFGPDLEQACATAILEQMKKIERRVGDAASLVLDAALCGLGKELDVLEKTFLELIRLCPDFKDASIALNHLLYLSKYDTVLEFKSEHFLAVALEETWRMAIYLLEFSSPVGNEEQFFLDGLRALLACTGIKSEETAYPKQELIDVLLRYYQDTGRSPLSRGAVLACLVRLRSLEPDTVLASMKSFATPDKTGDFQIGRAHV